MIDGSEFVLKKGEYYGGIAGNEIEAARWERKVVVLDESLLVMEEGRVDGEEVPQGLIPWRIYR